MSVHLGIPYQPPATAEQAVCGRCDRDPAGAGAQNAMDPKRGYIVACAPCLKQLEREVARARAREKERRA